MKSIYGWLGLIITIIIAAGGFYYYKTHQKTVHYHAGFRVYIDGKLQDYSGFKYMRISPCSQSESSHDDTDDQIEKAHLHDGNGDVVHIHRANPVWKDLFVNLKVKFPESKSVKGYINGKPVENVLGQPIKAYDSVLIMVGKPPSEAALKSMVIKDRIVQVEKQSEYCAGTQS